MIKNKIFFRVDSGTKIGYGHLIRCLSLAENLKKYYKVIFISSNLQGNIINELKIKKFPVYKLKSYSNHIDEKNDAKKTILLIKKYGGQKNLMIVDNYGLSKKWENMIKPHVEKLVVIDDLVKRSHNCDLLVDQNVHTKMNGNYDKLVPNDCIQLLGPKYAMVRDQFVNLRKISKIRTFPIKRILVSFGGSDIENQTLPLLKIIKKSNLDIHMDVIVGKSNLNKSRIKKICSTNKKFNYFEQTNKIPKLMLSADISIGSGGSTNWERCCLGLPAIISIVSKDQIDVTKALLEKKCIINLGDIKRLKNNDYLNAIISLNKKVLNKMSQQSFRLIDGKGKERISRRILTIFSEN